MEDVIGTVQFGGTHEVGSNLVAVGDEGLALKNRLIANSKWSENGTEKLLHEAVTILSGCMPAAMEVGRVTGLVVGFVQSGKTASFTAVTALARDNGYRMVIVLSGVTNSLYEQSVNRLESDLETEQRRSSWLFLANPAEKSEQSAIKSVLGASNRFGQDRTIVIPVLKHAKRIANLVDMLAGIDLAGCPTIIIDDEADQASLNNKPLSDEGTATYLQISRLRTMFNNHSYLQYTATPQAPLLINLVDVLSPDFVCVLSPGSTYVGGAEFFGRSELINVIEDDDSSDAPPMSLINAMKEYVVGVAVGLLEGRSQDSNRSMMVHPSSRKAEHAKYHRWVTDVLENWKMIAERAVAGELESRDEIEELFVTAYEELKSTYAAMPDRKSTIEAIPEALRAIVVQSEVNSSSGKSPEFKWSSSYGHVLVGGNILGRGFTVEGLTVSYMPRALGGMQVDTLQQRARWFGYKASYLGLCRVYLIPGALKAYESYVEHEDQMRRALNRWVGTKRSLKEWKRAFFLDRDFSLTRKSVIGMALVRGGKAGWWTQKFPHHAPSPLENVSRGQQLMEELDSQLELYSGAEHWSTLQHHLCAKAVPLSVLNDGFLNDVAWSYAEDSNSLTVARTVIATLLETDPRLTAGVVFMGGKQSDGKPRFRLRTAESSGITNLFQGRNPSDRSDRSTNYPGDQHVLVGSTEDDVTIQVHFLQVEDEANLEVSQPTECLAVAIRLPKKHVDWILGE